MKAELTDAERKDLSNRPSGAPSWQELNKQHNEACGMLNEQRKEIDALRAELAGCYECCKLSDAQIEKLKAELATAQATIAERDAMLKRVGVTPIKKPHIVQIDPNHKMWQP